MKLTALVGKVDMDGYCGRDPHPERSMEGRWFPVSKVHVENLGGVSLDDPAFHDYVITVRVPTSLLTEMDGDVRAIIDLDGRTFLDIEMLPHELHDLRVAFSDLPEIRAVES